MRLQNPIHEGELLVQQRAGETAKGKQNGRICEFLDYSPYNPRTA